MHGKSLRMTLGWARRRGDRLSWIGSKLIVQAVDADSSDERLSAIRICSGFACECSGQRSLLLHQRHSRHLRLRLLLLLLHWLHRSFSAHPELTSQKHMVARIDHTFHILHSTDRCERRMDVSDACSVASDDGDGEWSQRRRGCVAFCHCFRLLLRACCCSV